ncbi:hypothetical protein [Oerskovia jenensis]|uniref:hypothetical protein n=1 Tax=Oerskovia jenensis TaxID=162169 RepID=UPI0036D78058
MTSQDQQPRTTAYVPRHLAAPEATTRVAELPADPRSMRWDRSAGTLTRVLDELAVLDDGSLSVGRR